MAGRAPERPRFRSARTLAARRPTTFENQPILSIRGSVPEDDAETFIAEALHDIRVYMQEHDVQAAGPPFSVCRRRGADLDVEAGWPTRRQLAGTSRIHSGVLPGSLTARTAVAVGSEEIV